MSEEIEISDPPHIFVPEHIRKKLTHQETELCWHINSDRNLSGKALNDILKLLDAYIRARESEVTGSDIKPDLNVTQRIGTLSPDDIEMVTTEGGKLVPKPKTKIRQIDSVDENENLEKDQLPCVDLKQIGALWDEDYDIAYEKIAKRIDSMIQQMRFSFFAGDDPDSDTEQLRFSLLPQFPENQVEPLVYWYLAVFLSGPHADWLRGRCYYCKRFIINSDRRVKYCDSKHKDLYWRPKRRDYLRQKMAERRRGL